jgi:predicted nucleic acid-binding protein
MYTHREAARLYQACRAAGVTIRSTIDCFIAQLAIEQDLVLLHGDRDFKRMAEVAPNLRLRSA